MKTTTPAPTSATPPSVLRLLRDPEAKAAIERLKFLGYSPSQVGAAMRGLDVAADAEAGS